MERPRFDRVTAALARRSPQQGDLDAGAGLLVSALALATTGARTFDHDCRRFRLASGDEPARKFENLDDNLLVEVHRKGGWT